MVDSLEDLAVRSLGEWWDDMGVPLETPPVQRKSPQAPSSPNKNKRRPEPEASPRILRVDPIQEASRIAQSANDIKSLKKAVDSFKGCELKATARTTVLSDGVENAKIMIVGEAPGHDEDKAGLPFKGQAGQLLDKMMESIGISRKTNAYITNMVPWRPPGNRSPDAGEVAVCLPFLTRQIELIQPQIILSLGKFPTQALLNQTDAIGKLRGQKFDYSSPKLTRSILCFPLLHPAYLLRRPAEKSKTWKDLLLIQKTMNELDI